MRGETRKEVAKKRGGFVPMPWPLEVDGALVPTWSLLELASLVAFM